MDLPAEVRTALFEAGGDALRFNAPLGVERATTLAQRLSQHAAGKVVDLGCGRGEFARMIATQNPGTTVLGVESDERLVHVARAAARAEGLDHRVSFEVGNAAEWTGAADAAICIGASHAFGGPAEMLNRLAALVPAGSAIVGDAIWQAAPDPWCEETFGELPVGGEALAAEASRAGWEVVEIGTSTQSEWDQFEHGWIGGVRALGTEEAFRFAAQRERDYENYRGVLGFGWLVLERQGS